MGCQPSQREQIAFRRAYRALLAQGMNAHHAAIVLGRDPGAVRGDLLRHPLDEPLPDVENLLSSSELAAALGISVQQLPKRLSRFRIAPACRYCRILWYSRDVVERLKDGSEKYEVVPLDRIGEVKVFTKSFTTRKIFLFEQGAPIERVSDPTDKCMSPEQAEAECRIWRKRLDPEHYARLEQLLRFRVAIWRARVKRNREGFEPSSAGREPRGQYRPDDGGAGPSRSLAADRANRERYREGFEPSAAGDSAIAERVIRLKASRKLNPDPLRGVRITGDVE